MHVALRVRNGETLRLQVPGTHDIPLMQAVLRALLDEGERDNRTILVPRFDKAVDDRTNVERWQSITGPVDVVIWEGWCLGVPPQAEEQLIAPVNALEAEEDRQCLWRGFVNRALMHYQPLFEQVDIWVMLQPPSFDCVYEWRLEQEQKLAARVIHGDALMSAEQMARFIAFYQRLTEWGFATVPHRVDYLFTLDNQRTIKGATQPCREGR